MNIFVFRIDGTTWKVAARENGPAMGTINYPGNDPERHYHACARLADLGHFATRDEAAIAIIRHATQKESVG